MNNLSLASALLFEPRKAFDDIAQRPRFWFPFLAVLLCSLILSVWYCSVVDVPWLIDQSLRANALTRGLPEERIQEMIDRSTRGGLIAQVVVSTLVFLLLVRVLEALYYSLAGKIVGLDRRFKQWFAFGCWTGLPSALALVPGAIVLAGVTEPQIPQTSLQPLSVNELLLHLKPDQAGYALWSNFSLLNVAGLALAVVGVRIWSGRSWLFSTLFATLPMLLLIGIVVLRS
jgi:hypothetical protein